MTQEAPQFSVNQPVFIPGKDAQYIVGAVYRLENLYIYQLSGLPDFYVRESRLRAAPLGAAA